MIVHICNHTCQKCPDTRVLRA